MSPFSQIKFRTNYWLWIGCALLMFLPACVLHWQVKGDSSFDAIVRCLQAGLFDQAWDVFWRSCVFFGLPAILLAWPVQALAVICTRRARDKQIAQPDGAGNSHRAEQ